MSDWYESNIEEGIRPVVRLLRDNGFNTECSCEHERYVQCQYFADYNIKILDDLLYQAGFRNYRICIEVKRFEGHAYNSLSIYFDNLKEGDKR